MRYPFDPIDVHRGDTEISVLADKIGVAHSTIQKWRDRGMEEHNADRVATALGLHPWQLWPEMLAVATAPVMRECEHPDCFEEFILTRSDKRFCSARCRERAPERAARHRERSAAYARERYRSDPEYRARKQQERRAYSETARAALAAQQRAYYRRTAEQQRAARRARYWAKKNEEKAA